MYAPRMDYEAGKLQGEAVVFVQGGMTASGTRQGTRGASQQAGRPGAF